MANRELFGFEFGSTPSTNTKNAAGGKAYSHTDRHALAQLAVTGCFNGTAYAKPIENLEAAKNAVTALRNDPEFIAQTAIYARHASYMKDMPAFLMVALAHFNTEVFKRTFPIVIDNMKMLRNFIQIARSDVFGKKLNVSRSSIRGCIQKWFDQRSPSYIFNSAIGNDPSMKDILKICHPRPNTAEKAALFAYLKGSQIEDGKFTTRNKDGKLIYTHAVENLPSIVTQYEKFKVERGEVPNVDFRMLDSLKLTDQEWKSVAVNTSWQATRMNLQTFDRHNVFSDSAMIDLISDRLRNREDIAKAKAFPYQLMMAHIATADSEVPAKIKDALKAALEISLENVPSFDGNIVIAVDVSGSMGYATTGSRGTATSKVTNADVAALITSALLKVNPKAVVIPFADNVRKVDISPKNDVLTNAANIKAIVKGGTNCAAPLTLLNNEEAKADMVIFVSDNQSWLNQTNKAGTSKMQEWNKFRAKNPTAKLVTIDISPNITSQVSPSPEILQIGGWSDRCFTTMADFYANGNRGEDAWIDEIMNYTPKERHGIVDTEGGW